MKAVAFGTNAGHDKDYRRIHDFHCAIQAALLHRLPEPRCPLVLAGTEPDVASFGRVNTYVPTAGGVVLGSTDDGTSDAVLASLARRAASVSLSEEEKRALDRWERAPLPRRRTESLAVARAAADGKVGDLFVAAGSMDELINAAMVMTVRHHGHVWVLAVERMPEAVGMAALLRF